MSVEAAGSDVGWVEPFAKPITAPAKAMGIAEFIIGRVEERTRWINPSYDVSADRYWIPTWPASQPSIACLRVMPQ